MFVTMLENYEEVTGFCDFSLFQHKFHYYSITIPLLFCHSFRSAYAAYSADFLMQSWCPEAAAMGLDLPVRTFNGTDVLDSQCLNC